MDFLTENIHKKLFSAWQYSFLRNGEKKSGSGGTLDFDTEEKINDSTQFDLASLTKALVTVPLFYQLSALKEIAPDDDISRFFDTEKGITIYELLSHTSGFPAWLPFYRLIPLEATQKERRKAVEKIIFDHGTSTKSKCYSDLNYLLLGFILEKIFSQPIDMIFDRFKAENRLEQQLTYRPQAETPRTAFSELRNLCPSRTVEDENSYFLSGTTGHAGLFGSASDIVSYCSALLDTEWFLPEAEALSFAGFDRPEGDNSNYGKKARAEFIGHLGFTGTAFVIDCESRTIAALLTNSTHPTPDKPNRKEELRKVRQEFFDRVM